MPPEKTKKTYKEQQEEEVDRNFEFFQKVLEAGKIEPINDGKFALIKGQKIVGYFDTRVDASTAGALAYPDKLFSIQEVTRSIVDLGYYSHAVL